MSTIISDNVIRNFSFWSLVWILILNFPKSKSTDIISSYRLNFLHGLISSIISLCYLFNVCNYKNYFSSNFTTMTSISYFIIDFLNIILNDYVWKVKSYQTPLGKWQC